jgi:hypothetical protein
LYRAASSYAWTGKNPVKGVAVLAFGDYTLEPVETANATGIYAMPVRVRGAVEFNLLGLWTQGPGYRAYVVNAEAALRDHESFLLDSPAVVAGDFNSNAVWDRKTKGGHTRLVQRLDNLGLVSAYHAHFGQAQGAESQRTYFQKNGADGAFHMDYVFLPKAWAAAGCPVEVGAADIWLDHSDHMPLVVSTRP